MPSQPQPSRWPLRRWCSAIAVVFAAQVVLVLWLGERGPLRSRPPGVTPTLRLAAGISPEVLARDDPTLFALPHWRGFSGAAWLKPQPVPNRPLDWCEEPRPLALRPTQLGALLLAQAATNPTPPLAFLPVLEPPSALPDPPPLPLAPEQSRLTIEGDLARCRMLTRPDLPSWQYNDVLTNTGVQLLVDADGRPGAVILLFSSGCQKADDHALAQARMARFDVPGAAGRDGAAASTPLAHWVSGLLLFEWHTAPLAPTNAPPIK